MKTLFLESRQRRPHRLSSCSGYVNCRNASVTQFRGEQSRVDLPQGTTPKSVDDQQVRSDTRPANTALNQDSPGMLLRLAWLRKEHE